ncbi:U1 zinc finger domain-containing protein [Pyrenochaeta sp. MPI-SDFR-AT-0127]|nr:U1 zinc finger domain-containing protein [Pyrenochaeta sp. MPI-SDFR-AT-0127]
MAEYWKSTPKYWCKFCSTYVKDTKFERAQHEATGRHQGNIQRSLKGLHREQENEQRSKARAQAEVARLNGLVPSASTPSVATGSGGIPTFEKRPEKKATLDDRKRQWEQLAAMGVALPDAARGDLAIAGDWKTVSEQVVGEVNEDGEFKAMSLNKGVRKRKLDEEEEEQRAAGEVITKKKGWGHTYKTFPGSRGGEDDIESLFGNKPVQKDADQEIKEELKQEDGVKAEANEEGEAKALQDIPTAEEAEANPANTVVKTEEREGPTAPAIVFKKRKKVGK